MRTMLLAAATTVAVMGIPAVPAAAQAFAGSSFTAAGALSSPTIRSGRFAGRHSDRDHHGRHHHRDFDGAFIGPWDYGYDQNRGWEPDSFNDWWHDRPDRAFPRWVRHNDNCERVWWSGGGWRC